MAPGGISVAEWPSISGTGRDINEIPTATPTFSTTPTSMQLLPTLPDISRLLKINMAAVKPEVDCISGTGRHINEIPTATPTFSTTPTSMQLLPTLPDISRLLKINMAAVKPEVDCISRTLSTDPICYLNWQQIK
jgi:hypothetical protein